MNEDRDIYRNVKQCCQGEIGKENAIFWKYIKKVIERKLLQMCVQSGLCAEYR